MLRSILGGATARTMPSVTAAAFLCFTPLLTEAIVLTGKNSARPERSAPSGQEQWQPWGGKAWSDFSGHAHDARGELAPAWRTIDSLPVQITFFDATHYTG